MCLWISSVIVELCVVYSHCHLLELSLQHFSLLVKSLISIAHQTLCLSSRDVHRVWIVLRLLILSWAVIVIYTLVHVLNLWRTQICHTIAHLNWGELWCGALPWILAHLRLVFRGCAAIISVSLVQNILTWSSLGCGPFWQRVNQRRLLPPHSRHHQGSISSAEAVVNCGVVPFD